MHFALGPYFLSIACGVALGLSFPTWHVYPLAWVALVPLFRRVFHYAPRGAALQFFAAGFAFHLVLLQWLMSNVYWAGGWAWWGYVALCAALSLFWGAIGAIWAFSQQQARWLPAWFSLPVLWGSMEYLQSFLFSGFGWSAIAYSQATDLWLAQWASLGGIWLISAFVVACNVLLAQAWNATALQRRVLYAGAAVGLVLVTHTTGAGMMRAADYERAPLTTTIVQADFPLEMKWDPEYTVEMVRNAAEKSRIACRGEDVDLIVWPESLIMEDIERPAILEEVSLLTRDTGAALFAGAHRTNPETGNSMNSAYYIDPNGVVIDYYDKIHLAPFGEYVPFGEYLPFIESVVPAIGDIEKGSDEKVFSIAGRRFGPLICFEVIFPPMAESLRERGADFLIVITNLGWFGASNAIAQELEIARMRAIETRLPLVHCANTGMSGVFDPWGRFTPIDIYFEDKDSVFKVAPEHLPLKMARMAGVLPVAAPGDRMWEAGPWLLPNVMLALATAVPLVALVSRWWSRRRTK